MIERRDFLRSLSAGVTGGLMGMAMNINQEVTKHGDMPYRMLGKTGEKVSCIGLGGFHLGQSRLEEPDAIRLFQSAVDRGINFSDNSWDYNQGESERRVGKALKGRRDHVFVMSKFDGRTKESALKQLDDSLKRMELDHLDLWQFHENIRLEDPDRFFADGGANEAMLEAKKSGKVRSSALPVTRIPVFILGCCSSLTKKGLNSTRFRCRSMSWTPIFAASEKRCFRCL